MNEFKLTEDKMSAPSRVLVNVELLLNFINWVLYSIQ